MRKITFITLLLTLSLTIKAQIKINELQNDAGSNDSKSGEWIELYNTSNSPIDISCYRLTNGGNTRITIPYGTIIPSNGYLLIGRSSKMSCSECDFENIFQNRLSTKVIGVNGLYKGVTSPYDKTIFLDLDSCTCSQSSLAGVWNNANLGDRVVLFDNTLAVIDAWQVGGGNNYGTGLLTVTAPSAGLSCSSTTLNVPAVGDAIYTTIESRDIVGCNSSYALAVDGVSGTLIQSGNGNGSNGPLGDDYPTPGISNSLSLSPRYKFYKDGKEITSLTSNITVCNANPIDLKYEINNFQNVEPLTLSPKGKVGSFYRVDNGTPTAWTHTNVNSSGMTELSTTITPLLGTHTYEFYWADEIRTCGTICPGTSSYSLVNNASTSTYECYTRRTLNITYSIPTTAATLSCTSASSGMNKVSLTPASSTPVSYTLSSSGGYSQTNTTGIFQVLDSDAGTFTLTVTNASGCTPATVVTTVTPCKAPPLCPILTLNTLTSTASGNKCPGEQVSLCVNTPVDANLPNGGTVEWYKGTSSTFDPYTSPSSDLVCSKTIAVGTPTCPADGSGLYINELGIRPATGDGAGGGEFIELFNPGPCAKDISCYIVVHSSTTGGGAASGWTVRLPNNLTIPACSYFLIGGVGGSSGLVSGTGFPTGGSTTAYNGGGTAEVDVSTLTSRTWIRASLRPTNLNNPSGQISIHDASGTLVQSLSYNNGNNASTYPAGIKSCDGTTTSTLSNPGNSTTNVVFNSSTDRGISRTSSGTYVATTSLTPDQPNSSQQTCTTAPVTVPCCTYTLPATLCNVGTTYFKAIVKPLASSCAKANSTTAALNYTVTCVDAVLSGNGFVCDGGTNPTLTLTGLPIGSSFVLKVNGTNTNFTTTSASPYTFSVSTPGTYELVSATPSSGCLGTVSGAIEITSRNPELNTVYTGCITTEKPTYQFYSTENSLGAIFTYSVLSVDAGTIPSPNTNNSGLFTFDSATNVATVLLSIDYGSGVVCNKTTVFPGIACETSGPLPVELVYFKASKQGNDAYLKWITLSELNNDYFVVEHSVDAINFVEIGRVDGNGTSNTRHDYTYKHTTPPSGVNYYRLKQIDYDGKFKYSNIEFINFEMDNQLKVFPNPTNALIFVSSIPEGSANINIYDMSGKLMYNKSFDYVYDEDFTIDISKFSKGEYILLVNDKYFKLIKQ
jgi:hypothetical protein